MRLVEVVVGLVEAEGVVVVRGDVVEGVDEVVLGRREGRQERHLGRQRQSVRLGQGALKEEQGRGDLEQE